MGANSSRTLPVIGGVDPSSRSSSSSGSSSRTSSHSSLSSPVLPPALAAFAPSSPSSTSIDEGAEDVATPLPSALAAPEGMRGGRPKFGAKRSLRRSTYRSTSSSSSSLSVSSTNTPSPLGGGMPSRAATPSSSSEADSASITPSRMSRRSSRWSMAWAAGATSSDPASYFPAPPVEESPASKAKSEAAAPAVKPATPLGSKGKARAVVE